MLLQVLSVRSYVLQLPGKQARGIGISASLLPKPHVNKVLPAVTMRINGFWRLGLLDTGCSRPLVNRALCYSWEKKKVDVFTVGEGALRCCGIGCVQLDVGSGCPIDVEVLVADEKLLGFDMLLGFDIIKKLGGVYMSRDEVVSFPQLNRPVCTAITNLGQSQIMSSELGLIMAG